MSRVAIYFQRNLTVSAFFLCLSILFLSPGICTKIFLVVKCINLDNRLVLAADLNIECWKSGGEHELFINYFWIFLFLYVIGIPFFVSILLVSNRKNIADPESPRHAEITNEFGTLFLQVCLVFDSFLISLSLLISPSLSSLSTTPLFSSFDGAPFAALGNLSAFVQIFRLRSSVGLKVQ